MANRLRQSSARVSFFAFQDMITTVTGVLLLVTLLLTLYLNDPPRSPAQSTRNQVRDQVEQARREMQANAEVLTRRQSQLHSLTNRVFVIPEPDRSGRQPVLIVLGATRGTWSLWGQSAIAEFNRGDFGNLLEKWEANRQRLVFYVRPSGIDHFDGCRRQAERRGFTVGYDAADETTDYVLLSR